MIRAPLRRRAASKHTEIRRTTRHFGRFVYLLLVLGLFTYLASVFVGPVLFLRSDGIVTSDRFVVGAAYTASVVKVDVQPGDEVGKGAPLVTLESIDVVNRIAQLTQDIATLKTRETQLAGRRHAVETLLPIATRRLESATEASRAVAQADARGAATYTFQSTVAREAYDAERERASLSAEAETLDSELRAVHASISDLDNVLGRLRQSYSGGQIKARDDGTVGAKVPSPGQVVRAGDALLEVMGGEPYVLSYLPGGRLYEVTSGERVIVTDGVKIAEGHVRRVDAVADNLPSEFRSALGYLERQQVMRIEISQDVSFPYSSRIKVVSPWSFTHVFALAKNYLANGTASEATASTR